MSSARPLPADAKPWWQSRTLIGLAAMLLGQVLRRYRVDILPEELSDMLTLALETVGASLAIYGRVYARQALRLTRPGGPFNKRAEVRRAQAADPEWQQREGGHARLSVLVAVLCCYVAVGSLALPERDYSALLKCYPPEDPRPALVRLWESVRLLPVRLWPLRVEIQGGCEF